MFLDDDDFLENSEANASEILENHEEMHLITTCIAIHVAIEFYH